MTFISLKTRISLFSIFLFTALLAAPVSLFSWHCTLLDGPHKFSIGPEAYHLKRAPVEGTNQHGWLVGVRGVYERLVPNGIYWAAEGAWAKGPLTGNKAMY